MTKAKIFQVTGDKVLGTIGERLRFGARRELVTTAPVYAKTDAEFLQRFEREYLPKMQEILDDPRTAALLFPPRTLISVVASIDVLDGTPASWHLSMCRIEGFPQPPARAPDVIAHRICKAFFTGTYEEGPPEGHFKDVRHFRAPWKPD